MLVVAVVVVMVVVMVVVATMPIARNPTHDYYSLTIQQLAHESWTSCLLILTVALMLVLLGSFHPIDHYCCH